VEATALTNDQPTSTSDSAQPPPKQQEVQAIERQITIRTRPSPLQPMDLPQSVAPATTSGDAVQIIDQLMHPVPTNNAPPLNNGDNQQNTRPPPLIVAPAPRLPSINHTIRRNAPLVHQLVNQRAVPPSTVQSQMAPGTQWRGVPAGLPPISTLLGDIQSLNLHTRSIAISNGGQLVSPI
jgi:hypothetical protein